MFEIRDPIHRTIDFSDEEKKIIDHPFVQRLRYVRQLGLSYLVYPGATHDRFSHACGVMHIAGRIWSRIMETSGELLRKYFSNRDLAYFRRVVRLAGLLHDVGHPPFSHVSEKFMPPFGMLELPSGWFPSADKRRQATHEDYSVMMIAAIAKDDPGILTLFEAQDISSLIHHGVVPSERWEKRFGVKEGGKGGIQRLLRSFISGELDCDRMDYLLRDAHHTGVAYGTHDIDHLIGNLGVCQQPERGLTLTIDSTAVRAFEDFLLARYHMFIQVYMHKTTTAFDYFLEQALMNGEFELDVPGDGISYASLRDSTVLEKLFAAAEDKKNHWSRRLVRRHPPKMLLMSSNARADEKTLMEQAVSILRKKRIAHFTLTSHQYLSKAQSGGTGGVKSSMLVRRKFLGKVVYEPIERYSSLLNKYNEVIDVTHLYVLPEQYETAQKALAALA